MTRKTKAFQYAKNRARWILRLSMELTVTFQHMSLEISFFFHSFKAMCVGLSSWNHFLNHFVAKCGESLDWPSSPLGNDKKILLCTQQPTTEISYSRFLWMYEVKDDEIVCFLTSSTFCRTQKWTRIPSICCKAGRFSSLTGRRGAKWCQMVPNGAEWCKILPNTAKNCQKLSNNVRYCQILPNTAYKYL